MVFVVDDLGGWLVGLLADAGRKKLTALVLGSDQERALRQAAAAAVQATADEMSRSREQVGQLAMVISEVFREAVPDAPGAGSVTMLEGLQAGIARQLAVLDDVGRTGIGQSSAELLGVPGAVLAEKLNGHLLLEIMVRGSGGGPLAPLADQLNHDLTHLQGRQIEGLLVQLTREVRHGLREPTPAAAAAATRTLPRDIVSFTGRQQELRELVDAAAGAGRVVGIHAIGGMAGIGKTAFAVHAAHRLAPRFPAGQIFLQLHGHTPGQQPVDPGDALASLLLTAGVAPAQIPPGVEARMAMWRDRLAGRQLLLVLDDAVSSEQVQPLLPGSGGSVVLVTSRRHLSALEGATAISLETLSAQEAAGLLVRLAARSGLSPADPAVREMTRLCGYLPLAIGMLARQLHHHPAWSVAGRAAELAAAVDRLELMATENVSVAAAFNLSYEDLTADQQRLFRRLGLHPGTDVDAYAAAALDGTGLDQARRGLEALYDQYLLTEPTHGRYRMHDLIREHAGALAGQLDQDGDRDQATERLLGYYQYVGDLVQALLARQSRLIPAAGTTPAAVPALASREQALAWARAERANLFACLDHATGTGQHARIIALTADVAALLHADGPWAEALTRHAAAMRSARYLGDWPSLAHALTNVGWVRSATGDYAGAAQAQEEALGIYRDLGDRLGQANALTNLGLVRGLTDDCPGEARDMKEALGIYRDLGDRLGQANALTNLGFGRAMTDDYPGAARDLEEALDIWLDLGDRLGQARALAYLGDVRQMTGDYPGAASYLEEALGIYRDLGDRLGQARALGNLGIVRQATGDYPDAARVLEEALGIHQDLGNRGGQAHALSILGDLRRATGDHPGAARALEEALGIFHDIGGRSGQARALSSLGALLRVTGDHPGAARALEEALGIFQDIGDQGGEAEALNEFGMLHRIGGDLRQARSCHQQALDLARQIGSPWDEANALAGLGRCALAAGHTAEAQDRLGQALEIFQRIGAAEAAGLGAELEATRAAAHPAPEGIGE